MTAIGLYTMVFLPFASGVIHEFLPKKRQKLSKGWVLTTLGVEIFLILQALIRGQNVELVSVQMIDLIRLHFRLDGLGIIFCSLAIFLWLMATLYSFSYMKGEPRAHHFYSYMLCVLTAVIGIAVSGNLMMLYIFYELLTITTFPLIIFRNTEEAIRLGNKYLIYSFVGSSFVIVGMSVYFFNVGNLDFTPFSQASVYGDTLVISYLFLFLGFGVKTALVPFHSWLPSAMLAPTPVSALLHAVAVVKSGIFAMLRLNYYLFGAAFLNAHGYLQNALLTMVTVSILVGAFLAYHQKNLKRRLAYSTISQLGYIMLGILMSNGIALTGALLHFVNHAVIKMSLFFCVGSFYKNAKITDFDEVDGYGKKLPFSFGAFMIATISIMGLPPTNGFVSKWFLSLGAIEQAKMPFIFVMLFSAFMTALYLMPVGINAFFKSPKTEREIVPMDLSMRVPIAVLVLLCLLLGLFPNPLLTFINQHVVNYLNI
ncbi:proton-conducting membrane transporter [Fusibacter paucivorans]|uniref:Proton-conducting membrane transporter n=1 Tax=Fusibacter paucivorans TaxID=76009 RepID=A0ABS5PLR0_9FIRM|nr:proton-conducting transporter membrane subunit [Fusibacter paucivorans]MBS7526110.1 proton-conducting membrane transporter [Fusibacter paucivorans]